MADISSYKMACIIARFLDEKIAKDISILNISNVSSFADYFVICSSDTSTHVKSLTGYVREKVKDHFERIPIGEENDIKNRWNLLDYGDVIVHVLHLLITKVMPIYELKHEFFHYLDLQQQQYISIHHH